MPGPICRPGSATVTVTLVLDQADDEPLVNVFLDDVTLGSWLTPVIDQVDPPLVGNGSGAYVTLTGENFIQTPGVKLNGVPAVSVEWLDENQIRFQIPAGLPPGIYNLTVTNPGGQEAVQPGAFQFGHLIYAPAIMSC